MLGTFASIPFYVVVSLELLWWCSSPGLGEYWDAVEVQLCFHMEFRPCWSFRDCTHWARSSILLEKIRGLMMQHSEVLDPAAFQGKEGRGKLVSLG